MDDRFPYLIVLERDDWDVIQDWCVANIGEFDDTWYKLGIDPAALLVSGDRRTSWFFKNERDAIMFALRWR